jgi:hypothetical protein
VSVRAFSPESIRIGSIAMRHVAAFLRSPFRNGSRSSHPKLPKNIQNLLEHRGTVIKLMGD